MLDGKGLSTAANMRGPQPGGARIDGQYTGNMFQGAISTVPVPNRRSAGALLDAGARAHALLGRPPARAGRCAARVADSASRRRQLTDQIRLLRHSREPHVRSGSGRPAQGERRSIADAVRRRRDAQRARASRKTFTTFDNFYVDAEVSYDGHAFSTGAYATDFVEKMWPANYGRREGLYLSEGGYKVRNAFGNIAAPPQGYIWDFAKRANVSVRSYGEFGAWAEKGGEVTATVPGLEGLVHPSYPPFDLSIPDSRRMDIWLEEFESSNRGRPPAAVYRPARQRPHVRHLAWHAVRRAR